MISRETAVGERFAGRKKKVGWERLWAFSGGPFTLEGWPKRNHHTDLLFAQSCGMASVVASGTQYEGYLCELFLDLFGETWLETGSLTSKFVAKVTVDDVIQPIAVVKAKDVGVDHITFTFDTWCENQHAEKVLVGSATGGLLLQTIPQQVRRA